jgi:hypothetical protein
VSTYLQLCQAVGSVSGTVSPNNPLTAIADAAGRWSKIIAFTAEAWTLIQTARSDWPWMIEEVSKSTADGQASYSPSSDWSLTRVGDWLRDVDSDDGIYHPHSCRDPAIGLADEQELIEITYQAWRNMYGRGQQDENRPCYYAVAPNGSFCLGNVPDKAYTLRLLRRKAPQVLAADSDTPDMPAQYHDAIKWRALQMLAEHDQRTADIVTTARSFAGWYGRLVNEQVPRASV